LHAVDAVGDEVLLGDRAALVRDHRVALEPGRDDASRRSCVGQQVAGELLDEEAVVRLVRVECRRSHSRATATWCRPPSIEKPFVSGVARRVEPRQRHALAAVRAREQAIDGARRRRRALRSATNAATSSR
jgi:hypothetical protein